MSRRPLALLALCLLLLVASAPALASSLAVLPLGKGAASEQYDGLGRALAGMLVSDLSRTGALQLVERERLEDLLAEIALGESGFVDAATAQRLGRGVGAELVLMGSYSVVGTTFLLDVRVVRVEDGRVLKAADAQGTVADFVAVEKEVVEDLLEGLEVSLSTADRRRLLVEAPTESFEAFARYGEGLARREEGRIEEARKAFEAAVTTDPGFEAARSELAALRTLVEETRARREADARTVEERGRASLLAAVPDERTRPKRFRHDRDSTAAFGARMEILALEGRHCQRYEEMRAYLDRVGWQFQKREKEEYFAFIDATIAVWIAHGLLEPGGDRFYHYSHVSNGSPSLFGDVGRYVFGFPAWAGQQVDASRGMMAAMERCLGGAEQPGAVQAIREGARKAGVLDVRFAAQGYDVSLFDLLDLHEAWVRASHFGVDAEARRLAEGVVARTPKGGDTEFWVNSTVAGIVRAGEGFEKRRRLRFGLPEEAIPGAVAAIATEEGSLLRLDLPLCRELVALRKRMAEGDIERLRKREAEGRDTRWDVAGLAGTVAPLRDLGCLTGVPARFAGREEAFRYVAAAPERAVPEMAEDEACQTGFQTIGMVESGRSRPDAATLAAEAANPELAATMARMRAAEVLRALDVYYGTLVRVGCVEE